MPDHEFEYVRIEPWANYKELFSFSHDGIQECGLSRDEVYDKIVKVLYGTEKDRLAHVEQVRRAEIARLRRERAEAGARLNQLGATVE